MAWQVFPEVLGERIFPTRQEVFFFGIPGGDTRFAAPALPTWLFRKISSTECLILKAEDEDSYDGHGERVDPDTQSRIVTPAMRERVRTYVERRFPCLEGSSDRGKLESASTKNTQVEIF